MKWIIPLSLARALSLSPARSHHKQRIFHLNPHLIMTRIKSISLAILLPISVSYSQDALEIQPDRNVPPVKQYKERTPSNDPDSGSLEETESHRNQRIKERFGDSENAVVLIEDAEKNRGQWEAEQVRQNLLQARDKLDTVKATGVSAKKKAQLASSWGRLAEAERFLFGDTPNNLEWLRKANELDPDNEDVARALDVAERKHEYTELQLAEAAKIRAARNHQN